MKRIFLIIMVAFLLSGCGGLEINRTIKPKPCLVPPGENPCNVCEFVLCTGKKKSEKKVEKLEIQKKDGGRTWWQKLKNR